MVGPARAPVPVAPGGTAGGPAREHTDIRRVHELAVEVLLEHAQRHRQLALLLEQLLAQRVDGLRNFRAEARGLAGARLRAPVTPAVDRLGVAVVSTRFPIAVRKHTLKHLST